MAAARKLIVMTSLALLVSACGGRIVPPSTTAGAPAPVRRPIPAKPLPPVANPTIVPAGANAAGAGIVGGPAVSSLGIGQSRAARADRKSVV